MNDEREARLIYILLHPSLWRSLKHRKKRIKKKDIQKTIFPKPVLPMKSDDEDRHTVKSQIIKKGKIQTDITGKISSTGVGINPPSPSEIQSSAAPKEESQYTTENQSEPAKIPSPKQFVPEKIISLFGKSGDLELLCPFCKDTIMFRYEDVDRRTFKNTRICNSCESINRASITVGNRFIFADFEKYHPEIAAKIRKLENEEKDEFGNPIFTYSFLNTPQTY